MNLSLKPPKVSREGSGRPLTALDSREGPIPVCCPLSDLQPGEAARFCRIDPHGRTRSRLADLGFVPGTELCLVRAAPLGDPLELEVRGTRLCLRREEARSVWVHPSSRRP
jgi:Fe2+ transport system protein FeoA